MKNTFVEKVLFVFLLSLSGCVGYIILTRKYAFSSENALLLILSCSWLALELKTVRRALKKTYHFFKKLFRVVPKKRLHKI